MKRFLEKIVDGLPYTILFILIITVTLFMIFNGLHYDQLIGLIGVLIWPGIVLTALIFFRRIFTYLFFSMEEFNFFGNRGSLKNIQEVIEERVERKFEAEKKENEKKGFVDRIENELNEAKASKENTEKKLEETLKLANEIFAMYKNISSENDKLLNEVGIFRKEKADRELRHEAFRQRAKRRRENELNRLEEIDLESREPTAKEMDDAAEQYMQQTDNEAGE